MVETDNGLVIPGQLIKVVLRVRIVFATVRFWLWDTAPACNNFSCQRGGIPIIGVCFMCGQYFLKYFVACSSKLMFYG